MGFAIALAWSLADIVSVILPEQLMQFGLANWSGPMLFVFVISGVLLQPVARRLSPELSLTLGCVLLLVGYLIFTLGARLGTVSLVLLGVAIAGTACYGFTYLGGMTRVIRLSGTQSARAVSGYFILHNYFSILIHLIRRCKAHLFIKPFWTSFTRNTAC